MVPQRNDKKSRYSWLANRLASIFLDAAACSKGFHLSIMVVLIGTLSDLSSVTDTLSCKYRSHTFRYQSLEVGILGDFQQEVISIRAAHNSSSTSTFLDPSNFILPQRLKTANSGVLVIFWPIIIDMWQNTKSQKACKRGHAQYQ